MNSSRLILILLNLVVANVGLFLVTFRERAPDPVLTPVIEIATPERPVNYDIDDPIPDYLDYEAVIRRLEMWRSVAPELSEMDVYGTSSRGKKLYWFKVSGPSTKPKKTVLITACIHGNEPLSATVIMGYIGTLLDRYGDDPELTALLDERTIYFVPIVSPDSHPHSRHVDGVDPNRDFPNPNRPNHRSVPPVAAIQNLFREIKPDAVISGHTWGRVFLVPYGDRMQNSPDHAEYARVIGQMAKLSGYGWMRASDLYGPRGLNIAPIQRMNFFNPYRPLAVQFGSPIYGTEVDWYYREGSFSVVMEFGTHQSIPTPEEIEEEFKRTFTAMLHFVQEAPDVRLSRNRL